MFRSLNVHLLPALFSPEDVAGGIVVVVDILRASTTITEALVNGASAVVPCLTIDDALQVKAQAGPKTVLLGGERGGVKIEGFHFGNSPQDYHSNAVSGSTVAFTTTNGTKALHHSQQADEILIGCFRNFSCVFRYLSQQHQDIHVVCAGTNGQITSEDVLFAGALVDSCLSKNGDQPTLTDSTRLALDHWRTQCGRMSQPVIHKAICTSLGGRNLVQLGFDSDLHYVSKVDSVSGLARLDEDGSLKLVPDSGSATQ